MHPTSRIHEKERKCPHPTVTHKVPLGCAMGHCPPTPPFLVLCMGMATSKLLPGALVNFTGGVSWPAHKLPYLADGVEGRANLHIPLHCKPCTEDGFELRGCSLTWRDKCNDMLCVVMSARNLWQRWAVGDGSAVSWPQQHLAELICLCISWLCSANAKVLQGITRELFFPSCLSSQIFYTTQLEKSMAPFPTKFNQYPLPSSA